MKRTVQLFIYQGKIEKEATPHKDQNDYGEIKVINSVYPGDSKEKLTVYTHYKHSFLWDYQKEEPMHNKKGASVFFFLVPMEYLFPAHRLIGSTDDTPFLAVNVNDMYPFVYDLGNGSVTRHPCTTALTIAADTFESFLHPTETPISLILFDLFYFVRFRRWITHKNRRFLYGMNDYGELTIIDISIKDIEEYNIRPWSKIILQPRFNKTNAFFSRTYSPKKDRKEYAEYKILVQKFDEIDPDWDWVIDQPFGDQPILPNKPIHKKGHSRSPKFNPNLSKDNTKYPGKGKPNRWIK